MRTLLRAAALALAGALATSAAADDIVAGALRIEAPWMRATPGGAKVAGGYLRVTNTGTSPDRLVGGSLPIAGRVEIHSMSHEGGVMKMRPVEGGLEIRPGQTVELKPGGYHMMFMDLTGAAKEGDTVEGTLVFEKAGTVEVRFQVGGVGSQAAPAAGHRH